MDKRFHILIICLLLALSERSSYAAENNASNQTYIIGHWNYPANSVNPIYVVSDGEDVELFINGISNGFGRHESKNLFIFDNVIFQPGTLTAISYDSEGKESGQYTLTTSGTPAQLKLTVLESPVINQPESSEEMIIQCEVTDFQGKRCLLDNRMVLFEIEESTNGSKFPAQLHDNNLRIRQLPVNKGENRISVKKPSKSGEVKVTAKAPGLAPADVTLVSK